MRVRRYLVLGLPLLFVLGAGGCMGQADPVTQLTPTAGVAPEANNGVEGAIKAQRDQEKRQQEADKKAGRRY